MKIQVEIDYSTAWGERLCLRIGQQKFDMNYIYKGTWQALLEDVDLKGVDSYSFEVWEGDSLVRTEWRPHLLGGFKPGTKSLVLHSRWNARPENSAFYSSFFTDVVFRRTRGKVKGSPSQGNLTFMFHSPEIRSDQAIAITGSGKLFSNWEKMVLLEDEGFPMWKISLGVKAPFEYKFVVVDRKTHEPVLWEKGENHFFAETVEAGTSVIVEDVVPVFETIPWRGAGTAVPVFSLRSESSFGVGEFNDLRLLVDWAVATGQNVIQLLPINDTTMTGTWQDSYPYNANTTFALHPQFINLPDAGVKVDRAFRKLRDELNALPKIDYERVNGEKARLLREHFALHRDEILSDDAFVEFESLNRSWLLPYAVFCCLRDEKGTPEFAKWGKWAEYSEKKVSAYAKKNSDKVMFYCWEQFCLDSQLTKVVQYAHSKGVALKGDLPIGISRTSVDAWQYPDLYHMDSQAGAPPDAFSTFGQNWGFPTYNWEKMSEDGFAWWKSRMRKMAEYFDAFRIDHILGFFRIWEIPLDAVHGLLGHFNPALPYSAEELREMGFDLEGGRYTTPILDEGFLGELFGEEAGEVAKKYIKDGRLVPEVATQRKAYNLFAGDDERSKALREGFLWLHDDVLFVEDPWREGYYHPRIEGAKTHMFQTLSEVQKREFVALHTDFYYHRHNDYWKDSALMKLPALLESTSMLICGEDLGMIPACVPQVMKDLGILSLEIQRMPKDPREEFASPATYPYMCVCATGTHDTEPLRAWWELDRETTAHFYYNMMGGRGDVPYFCEPWVCEDIIQSHAKSPAMLAILPLQDWLSIDGKVRFQGDPAEERINVPAIPRYYWRYRMHLSLEALLGEEELCSRLRGIIRSAGRNI